MHLNLQAYFLFTYTYIYSHGGRYEKRRPEEQHWTSTARHYYVFENNNTKYTSEQASEHGGRQQINGGSPITFKSKRSIIEDTWIRWRKKRIRHRWMVIELDWFVRHDQIKWLGITMISRKLGEIHRMGRARKRITWTIYGTIYGTIIKQPANARTNENTTRRKSICYIVLWGSYTETETISQINKWTLQAGVSLSEYLITLKKPDDWWKLAKEEVFKNVFTNWWQTSEAHLRMRCEA